MATGDYCDLAILKARMDIVSTDTQDDALIIALISAASRAIDKETGRFFYSRPASGTETRYYTARDENQIYIDDCVSITELATDNANNRAYATIWSATDYDLEPYNAALNVEPEPYTALVKTPNGRYFFPLTARGVRVKGVFGWSAVPGQIAQAVMLQAHRWFKRKDAIFGVMGSADMGQLQVIPKMDPDVAMMVRNYRKVQFG